MNPNNQRVEKNPIDLEENEQLENTLSENESCEDTFEDQEDEQLMKLVTHKKYLTLNFLNLSFFINLTE